MLGIVYPKRIQDEDQYIRVHSNILRNGTELLGAKPFPVTISWEPTEFLYQPVFLDWGTVETWGKSHTWNLNRTYAIEGASMIYPQQQPAEPFVIRKDPPAPVISDKTKIAECTPNG